MSLSSNRNTTQLVLIGVATVSLGVLVWYSYKATTAAAAKETTNKEKSIEKSSSKSAATKKTSKAAQSSSASSSSSSENNDATSSNQKLNEKQLHAKIEELDKKGKVHFKNKELMQAAQCFTEALDLISQQTGGEVTTTDASSSLNRQVITLLNNRSAMYEKDNMPELSLEDVGTILQLDPSHTKARTRRLRLLEHLKRHYDALVEVCAIQLLFMQTHRSTIAMGLPLPQQPPIPPTKMEEIVSNLIPSEMEKYTKQPDDAENTRRGALPSNYTIIQLLKSYTDYNGWMALAAKDGPPRKDEDLPSPSSSHKAAQRALALLKRGRRRVYEQQYEAATVDFEEAYALVETDEAAQQAMATAADDDDDDDDDEKYTDGYARLLEWTGMVRHWRHELQAALECYEKCSVVEPNNVLVLVKQAGVQMDNNQQKKALEFFDDALKLDPKSADALFHRANLYMLQAKPIEAKTDLEACLKTRPSHVMARLRLASILASMQDANRASEQLDLAEKSLGASNSSAEILSYRGELCFTQGEMQEARKQFDKAIAVDPTNPTPYMNAALTLLNTPPQPGQMPDPKPVMELLEKAIEMDPQFTAAYIQLGQLKLGTARDLESARQVISLYDTALEHCRTPEEIKELCSMRVLAVAQVDAATMLRMETFSLQ